MRSSVNIYIAKPLHEVLTRQHLWQVSQFSSLLNNESNTSSLQVSDSTGETQKAEKCLFESTGCRYSPGNCEVIHLNGQPIIKKRHVPNNEDRVATTTFYYEPSFLDRDEIGQANSGSNNVYSVVSYHTSSCNPRAFESPEKYSSYKEHIENIEEFVELDNSKESEYANKNSNCRDSSNTEPSDKLKQFKEGVIEKIKQGYYASTSTFNNKQLNFGETNGPNTVKTNKPSCDNPETENEYVRSILNGIPSQNNSNNINYNLTSAFPDGANYSDKNRNEYHNATSQSKNSDADRKYEEEDFSCHWVNKSLPPPVQFGIANKDSKKYSQSENISDISTSYKVHDDKNQFTFNMVPLRPNLKNKGVNDERPQPDPSSSMISKNSTLIDSQNQTNIRENEEFRSRSYSLRNGYDESDILKQELTTLDVSDRRFHSSSESYTTRNDLNINRPESYRLRNGFTPSKLQEYSSNAIPVKPVYKKGSFGSNFKKYTTTEIVSQTQYSSKREPLTISNDRGVIESSQIDSQEETTNHPNNRNNDEPKIECQTSNGSNDKDKPPSEKYSKSDITVLGHQNDAPKEYAIDKIFNSETFNEKENSLNKELIIQNNKHLESTVTDKHLKSNQIGSYYQSDRQNKVLSESTQLEFKPVTQSQDSEVKKQVTTNVKPSNISQAKSGESEALTKIALPAKENIIASALKSTSFQSGCTKDIKDDKNESVPFMLVKSKPPEQCPESNKSKTNTSESAFHNSSKLGNCNLDSVIGGELVAESYKQKSKKNLLKESEHSQKLTLKMDILKDKTKTNSLNNISIISKASETRKVESSEVTSKDNQSCKANVKVQGISNMVDDREKGAEITFPGIIPPTFSIPVSYENVNKCDQKPKGKADAAEKSTSVNKANTNKDILTLNTTGTREFNFKLGKNESIQSKISTENSNKNKTQNGVVLNNTKQGTELQANNVINLNNKTNGKSTGHPSNKKYIDDLEARKARVNSVKPDLKKLANSKLHKENNLSVHSRDSYLNPFNADKLATLLKEHRVLLEQLLEKLNGRTPPSQSENSSGIKKNMQQPEELKNSDSLGGVSKTEQFKKMLTNRINTQEKVKRLHPRHIEPFKTISNLEEDVSKEEDVRTDTGPKLPSYSNHYRDMPSQDSRNYPKGIIDKPLKRFHVVTMMTSPSKRLLPKKSESLLDGTELSKYNFSPLKQILSQYRVEWSIKPRRLKPVDRVPLLSSPINKKFIHKGINDKTNWRNIYYTTNLNTSEKDEKSGKSKENLSLVKKITIVNKKKNYNIKDNIKKRHLNSKNKTQISIMSNLAKKTKIHGALVKQEQVKSDEGKKYVKADKGEEDVKTGDVKNTKDKSTEENNVKLSKGIIFDSTKKEFHKSGNKNYSSICTRLNNEMAKSVITVKKEKQKSRSLKDVEHIFPFIRPSEYQKPAYSGLESKSNIFNLEYSNNIIKGPMWVATPEYNHNKVQWNLPARPNSTKTDTINNELKINKTDTGKTIDVVNSLSKKFSLSEVMSLSSKTNLSGPSSVLVSKSSVLPLPMNFFNRKSIPKSETDISRTVGIKKISTCKTDKDYEKGEVFKLSKHFSDSTILLVPSITSNINEPYVKQQDYKELDTVTNAPDQATNNLLGSYKDSKCSKYSIAGNNLLFGRIRKSDILNTIKPSFYSFRSMSHKDSSPCKDEDSLPQTEEKLEMLPEKKILTNNQYFKYIISTPRIDSIKFSWTRILNKVKHMVKAKCSIDNSCCCIPDFDEMMTSISKDVEKNCLEKVSPTQKNPFTNKFSKQLRSNELALTIEINGKSGFRNTNSKGEPKVLIIPKFFEEEVKNF